MESDLRQKLIDCGAIQFGEFTLASGKKSNYYINIKKAVTDTEILRTIAKAMVPLVNADKLAGIELGSVPLAVALALESNKKYVIVRKEQKLYGTQKLIEGEFVKGERIMVIEDVTTTGKSSLRSVQILRNAGAIVDTVLTVVDREEGGSQALEKENVKLISLLKAQDLLDQTSTL